MEKKIVRIFEPSIAMCFVVMLLFAAAAFLSDLMELAAVEAGVTLVLFTVYIVIARKKKLQLRNYILSTTSSRDTALTSGLPFPIDRKSTR